MLKQQTQTESMDCVSLTEELYAYRCKGAVCVELLEANMMANAVVERFNLAVEELIQQHKGADIVLDLQHVQWMCSLMLGKLVAMAKYARAHSTRILLAGLSAQLQSIIRVTKLTDILPMFDDVNTALRRRTG